MDPGGYTTNLLSSVQPAEFIATFAAHLGERWPDLVVSRSWGNSEWTADMTQAISQLEPSDVVFFARDHEMVAHFDEFASLPMSDGEGVVAIEFHPRGKKKLYFQRARNHAGDGVGEFSEILVPQSPSLVVGLITPQDVDHGEFSAQMLDYLFPLLSRDLNSRD